MMSLANEASLLWLFDTQIFLFRTSTVFFIIFVFGIFFWITCKKLNSTKAFLGSLTLTILSFLVMELSWEIASELRWWAITPLHEWIVLQGQPVLFLAYFAFLLPIISLAFFSANRGIEKREVILPLIVVFCYYIIANLISTSIYYNDYGYAIKYSGITFTDAQKMLFLIPEYFMPRILFIGALLVTHLRVESRVLRVREKEVMINGQRMA